MFPGDLYIQLLNKIRVVDFDKGLDAIWKTKLQTIYHFQQMSCISLQKKKH